MTALKTKKAKPLRDGLKPAKVRLSSADKRRQTLSLERGLFVVRMPENQKAGLKAGYGVQDIISGRYRGNDPFGGKKPRRLDHECAWVNWPVGAWRGSKMAAIGEAVGLAKEAEKMAPGEVKFWRELKWSPFPEVAI